MVLRTYEQMVFTPSCLKVYGVEKKMGKILKRRFNV